MTRKRPVWKPCLNECGKRTRSKDRVCLTCKTPEDWTPTRHECERCSRITQAQGPLCKACQVQPVRRVKVIRNGITVWRNAA